MKQIKAVLKQVSAPQKDCAGTPVGLSDETIAERKQKVLAAMKARGLDQLIHKETGMPVFIAEYPLDCVAEGTGKILENLDKYRDAVSDDPRGFE